MYKLTETQRHYARRAREIASAVGIDQDIFAALIFSESSFRPNAIGPEIRPGLRAIGIAQFLPETAKRFGIDPLNPEQSLMAAAQYLKELKERYGSYEEAVAAYKGFKDRQSSRAKSSFVSMLGGLFGGIKQFRDFGSEILKPTMPEGKSFAIDAIENTSDKIQDWILKWLVLGIGAASVLLGIVAGIIYAR